MEEYTNKWNINMNTLGLADYNVKEKAKIYGYAAKKDEFVESYLYEEESECVIAWYNAHCQSVDQISEICEIVLDQDDKKAALENCQATLEKFSYKSLSEENQLTYDVLSSYLILLWYMFMGGLMAVY